MQRNITSILIATAVTGLIGCRPPGHASSQARTAVAVRVETVRTATVTRTIQLLATIQGENQVLVNSKISGRVTEIVKPEGSTVTAGEPIAYVLNDVPGMDYQPGPVIAPISGIVGKVYVEPGQTVSPATPFAAIASFSGRIKARALASEADLPHIRRGAPARLSFSTLPDTTFSGTVSVVPPMLDPLTRSATVEILVPNPNRRLIPGMTAAVTILAEERPGVTAIPLSALFTDGSNRAVVVEGTTARFRTVQTGLIGDDLVEIVSGLQPGERVATLGKERIRYGETVNPIETDIR